MDYTTIPIMPELPEVETIRSAIEPLIRGQRLVEIELRDPSIVRGDPVVFRSSATGMLVPGVARRGKHLLVLLEGGQAIAVHLRMTGSLLLKEPEQPNRVRAALRFSNGTELFFNDMRRLGTFTLVTDVAACSRKLGPEPLSHDFTPETMSHSLSKRRIPIKAALLDQHIVAGIGNMYADEALFEACIHPLTPASALRDGQIQQLWQGIRDILKRAIACQGASINTYALPNGERGTAHDTFKVAHKKGLPCPRCGTPIERLMVRKRGAYCCPASQRMPDVCAVTHCSEETGGSG